MIVRDLPTIEQIKKMIDVVSDSDIYRSMTMKERGIVFDVIREIRYITDETVPAGLIGEYWPSLETVAYLKTQCGKDASINDVKEVLIKLYDFLYVEIKANEDGVFSTGLVWI